MVNKLAGTFSRLNKTKILVIGDLILDTYTIGKARRISPEAPVAVVSVHHEEHRPGGAGNVILNLISLGSEVVCVGRVGYDKAGTVLSEELQKEQVDTSGIVVQQGYVTPVKNRIIAEGQQIVRVDHEVVTSIPEQTEQFVIDRLPELLRGVQVVAISDYGKGFLTRTLLSAVIELARQQNIPVIADPKGVDFTKYMGVYILKPNLGEAYAAANLGHEASLDKVAARVLEISQAEVLMITRSEAGISLFFKEGNRMDFPVRVREIKDVTGAGDTVLAMLSCGVANELPLEESVQLCNIAAGIAIEHFGCARVTLSDLARRLLESDVVNKVFDEEHIFALQQALKNRKFAILGLMSVQNLNPKLFGAIKKLTEAGRELLVFVSDKSPDPDFINLIASVHAVNFIVVHADSLSGLCKLIEPEEVFVFENNELLSVALPSLLSR
jgi:D-beta-D-heptose 7-phosphate kinase/D-beta-D-heptose 1-phosphate adenosyltransferase